MTDLPRGWFDVTTASQALEAELHLECSSRHPLHGQDVEPLARRYDRDDVFFRVGGGGTVAQVHLTWTGATESNPKWPTTHIFDSLEEWAASVFTEDAAD
jgi:hypothetical protein